MEQRIWDNLFSQAHGENDIRLIYDNDEIKHILAAVIGKDMPDIQFYDSETDNFKFISILAKNGEIDDISITQLYEGCPDFPDSFAIDMMQVKEIIEKTVAKGFRWLNYNWQIIL